MVSGWRYRVTSPIGAAVIAVVAVAVANHPSIQELLRFVPVATRLPTTTLSNGALTLAIMTVLVIVLAALFPLYKPRPRRVLDVVAETQRRVVLASFMLATVGYFDYTYRLPRSTLVLTTAMLLVWLPAWFVLIRRRKRSTADRVIIVGDDPDNISTILDATDIEIFGYVSLSNSYYGEYPSKKQTEKYADGGAVSLTKRPQIEELEYLGGLSRLNDVIVENDVDTVILAFSQTDRQEFFGVLNMCYNHGVTAKTSPKLGNNVLTRKTTQYTGLVDIDIEPWDWQDRLIKRIFDLCFVTISLGVLIPLICIIAVAIKLDSPGPVLYSQERTAELGKTFRLYKFRSMIDDAEAESGATLSEEDAGGVDPRVTTVGHILRKTHLDEIPQLLSILGGDMSVVGPRPERPILDDDIGTRVEQWRRRWFVKPGLTGLAQINDITGHDPSEKLRYDTLYIRQRSLWFDVKIIVRQFWKVVKDTAELYVK